MGKNWEEWRNGYSGAYCIFTVGIVLGCSLLRPGVSSVARLLVQQIVHNFLFLVLVRNFVQVEMIGYLNYQCCTISRVSVHQAAILLMKSSVMER
jgi:hypothetical protein